MENKINKLYKRVMAMVPEATSVSVNVSRQTSTDGNGAFTMFTVMLQVDGAYIAHASCEYTESDVLASVERQVAEYRTAKAAMTETCPACGKGAV